MVIINEWVISEISHYFKHRTELHHIYKLDENTLRREYEYLGWYFDQFGLDHLDNQTMSFTYYNYGRENYHFFRLTDTIMFLIHRTHRGKEYIKIIKFHKTLEAKVKMELLKIYNSYRINRIDAFDLQEYINSNGTPKKSLKKYKLGPFNFGSSRQRPFKKLKGDRRLGFQLFRH